MWIVYGIFYSAGCGLGVAKVSKGRERGVVSDEEVCEGFVS